MNVQLRALNRFGLGARVGKIKQLGDAKGWLKSQLHPSGARMQTQGLPSLQDSGGALQQLRRSRDTSDEATRRTGRLALQEIAARELSAALQQRITSPAPFLERLVAFWSNHLCVSAQGNVPVVALAGHYERTVIRPHVLGRFSDMVLASARHPAMLIYLDNARSIGPSSRGSKMAGRRGRSRGLNENYARELLELHTVGVDGGYTQKDVEQLALIFTGWTVAGLGPSRMGGSSDPAFLFHSALHEPGNRTVLGARYSGGGVSQGEKVIRDLCRKPETARFLADKLVRHFVADDPPQPAVDRLARIYQESDGDLLEVSAALIDLEEAWDEESQKFRTPQDWLVAALRAIGVSTVPRMTGGLLRQLRHPLWAPSSPKGFGDSVKDWADPDSLMNRAELSRSLSRLVGRVQMDPESLLEVVDLDGSDPLGPLLTDASIGSAERVALGLAGPAFQWR